MSLPGFNDTNGTATRPVLPGDSGDKWCRACNDPAGPSVFTPGFVNSIIGHFTELFVRADLTPTAERDADFPDAIQAISGRVFPTMALAEAARVAGRLTAGEVFRTNGFHTSGDGASGVYTVLVLPATDARPLPDYPLIGVTSRSATLGQLGIRRGAIDAAQRAENATLLSEIFKRAADDKITVADFNEQVVQSNATVLTNTADVGNRETPAGIFAPYTDLIGFEAAKTIVSVEPVGHLRHFLFVFNRIVQNDNTVGDAILYDGVSANPRGHLIHCVFRFTQILLENGGTHAARFNAYREGTAGTVYGQVVGCEFTVENIRSPLDGSQTATMVIFEANGGLINRNRISVGRYDLYDSDAYGLHIRNSGATRPSGIEIDRCYLENARKGIRVDGVTDIYQGFVINYDVISVPLASYVEYGSWNGGPVSEHFTIEGYNRRTVTTLGVFADIDVTNCDNFNIGPTDAGATSAKIIATGGTGVIAAPQAEIVGETDNAVRQDRSRLRAVEVHARQFTLTRGNTLEIIGGALTPAPDGSFDFYYVRDGGAVTVPWPAPVRDGQQLILMTVGDNAAHDFTIDLGATMMGASLKTATVKGEHYFRCMGTTTRAGWTVPAEIA